MKYIAGLIGKFKADDRVKLKYLLFIFKSCGLAPISLDLKVQRNVQAETLTFTHSRVNIAVNMVILCLTVVINGFNMYLYKISGYYANSIYYANDTIAVLGVIIIISIFSIRHKSQINLFNKIHRIKLYINLNDDKCEESDLIQRVKWTFPTFALIFLGLITTELFTEHDNPIMYIIIDTCHFLLNMVIMQYDIVVKYVRFLLIEINKKLLRTLKRANSPYGLSTVILSNYDLSRTWNAYAQLNKVSRDISNFYSPCMLLIVIAIFSNLISISYYNIARPLLFEGRFLNVPDYFYGIFAVLIYMYPYVLFTTSVSATVIENRSTRDIISNQLRQSRSRAVKEKLSEFSIDLLYRNIEFRVFDFFPLNGSLLVSIVGTAATYLVILLQFHKNN